MHELGDRTTRGAPRARARAERGRAHLRAGVRRTRRGRRRRASTRRRGRWRERRRRFRRGPRGRPGPQLSQRPSRRRWSPSRSAMAVWHGGDWRGSWPRGVGRAGDGRRGLVGGFRRNQVAAHQKAPAGFAKPSAVKVTAGQTKTQAAYRSNWPVTSFQGSLHKFENRISNQKTERFCDPFHPGRVDSEEI
jgi:hypothetical protein